jgi:hypothetical protein
VSRTLVSVARANKAFVSTDNSSSMAPNRRRFEASLSAFGRRATTFDFVAVAFMVADIINAPSRLK